MSDPAAFRRGALMLVVLAQLRGEDPDAGYPPDEAELRREVRRLLIERYDALEGLSAEAEDQTIIQTMKRARRTLARKAKRVTSGREWQE